ncbi:MAG: galactokinase [Oligoflexales bacterium]|nr:galactokinase [Oligoflexales bacterium]
MDKETSLEQLMLQSKKVFKNCFQREAKGIVSCPGRINILGEHTDYMGGLSLPAAISRYTLISYAPLKEKKFKFWSQSHGEFWETDFSLAKRPTKNWQLFAYGALSIVKGLLEDRPNDLPTIEGACFSIIGNIPLGKGLSSSASLELCLLNSLYDLFSLKVDPMNSIHYARRIENEFLGVPSGLLDQFACQFSDRNKIQIVDFKNLSMKQEHHQGLADWKWVCIDSGVKRTLGSSEYPKRVQQCEQALATIKEQRLEVSHYRDISEADLSYLDHNQTLKSRMSHMIGENLRTLQGFDALVKGDIPLLGKLLEQSHHSLRDLFEVSTNELDFLKSVATKHPACAGSRIMGGGFGGCTLNLVKADKIPDFLNQVQSVYSQEFHLKGQGFIFDLVDGVKLQQPSLQQPQ